MDLDLTLQETRVIGALIEKEITTPDQYPLSLNALTLACNQKSNREPVLNLSERDVQTTLGQLQNRRLVREETGYGSRVPKYRHRFCNTEFSELQLSPGALAILTVLFLRGPQTPGELRARTQRLHPFDDVEQIERELNALAHRQPEGLVVRLARQPGKREHRYAHLFSGPVTNIDTQGCEPLGREALQARITTLETELVSLRRQLAALDE
ncbi:YceH family protein [Motiliproteus sediminis]|uniref:YceH family protein n=1 Tax=Motiliproteus sediminis TaxID=1468178 RepID=UPI001AEFA088